MNDAIQYTVILLSIPRKHSIFPDHPQEVIPMQNIIHFITFVLDSLFPDECIGCRKSNTLLCEKCLARIPRAEPAEHSFIHPLFTYRSPVMKEVINRLKYKNVRRLATYFGDALYEEIIHEQSDYLSSSYIDKVLLIDIPLHKKRLRERGYNQSELLVQSILNVDQSHTFEHIPNILVRARNTKSQARSEKRSVRIANLKNAFVCSDPSRVRGRIVVLIDDVTTTGATLLEARRALITAKPRKVFAVTLAH